MAVYDAGTGRPLTALAGFGLDGGAEFHPDPARPRLGIVTSGADDGHGSWWVAPGPAGPTARRLGHDRLIGPVGAAGRYVTWHAYRLAVVDAATGHTVAERDASGDHPPHLALDGRAVPLTDGLLLVAGHRTPPGAHGVTAEHVVLSTAALRRSATVDYGVRTDDVRLVGSAAPGTWLTVDRAGTATVWSVAWPLAPLPGQLTLL